MTLIKSKKITFFLLLLFHLILLIIFRDHQISDLIFPTWLLSNSKFFISEEYINHPILLPNLIVGMNYIFHNLPFTFLFLQTIIVLLVDIMIVSYLYKQVSYRSLTIGMFFYIFWQSFFQGGTLYYDFMMAPFILLSSIFFMKFISQLNERILLLSSSILGLGILFKQTVLEFFVLYFGYMIILLIKNKVNIVKSFKLLTFLVVPPLIILIGYLIFVANLSSIMFALNWSFIIPFFIQTRLSTYNNPIEKEYILIITLIFIIVICAAYLLEKSKKTFLSERLFLYLLLLFSFFNLFPWWAALRMQIFVIFLTIILTKAYDENKNVLNSKKVKVIISFVCVSMLLIFTNRLLHLPQNGYLKFQEYAPSTFPELKNRTIFLYDSPLYVGNPVRIENNANIIHLFLYEPDKYFNLFGTKASLEYVQNQNPDSVILPGTIDVRLGTKDLELTELEYYIKRNYTKTSRINNLYVKYDLRRSS